MIMRHRQLLISIILFILVIICACTNRNKPDSDSKEVNTEQEDSAFITSDTLDRPTPPEFDHEPSDMDGRPPHGPHMGPPPPDDRFKPDDDNMRGFDPASEDDMDDNGMSRYMENNDEEGWN